MDRFGIKLRCFLLLKCFSSFYLPDLTWGISDFHRCLFLLFYTAPVAVGVEILTPFSTFIISRAFGADVPYQISADQFWRR